MRATVAMFEQALKPMADGVPQIPSWLPEFRPRAPWWGGHLQTLAAHLQSTDDLARRFRCDEHVLPLDDGTGDSLAAKLYRPAESGGQSADDRSPLIVLLHGLGGTSQSRYIQSTANYLLECGHRVLLIDFRGAGDSQPHTARLHHPGRTEDIKALLRAAEAESHRTVLDSGVVVVGYSLGGSVLLNFLSEWEQEDSSTWIRGAVTVSAPLDLAATSKCLGRPSRLPYRRYLLHRMRGQALRESAELTAEERQAVVDAKTVWEFDRTFMSPRCGFECVEDYYSAYSAGPRLADISVPTMLIYALDDPFNPAEGYRAIDWASLPMLIPVLVPSGGHVGFQGKANTSSWHNECIDRFVKKLVTSDHTTSEEIVGE